MENLEVREISREVLKPSTPTPSHLKTFKLSILDQLFQVFYSPIFLVYDSGKLGQTVTDLAYLKTTFSQALSRFYPLAGRFTDESTITCNDQGIPFIVTRVTNCPRISTFLSSSDKLDLLPKFFPPQDSLGTSNGLVSEVVPMAFQINAFDCGGVVIGCYLLHKIIDGIFATAFLRHWASLAAAATTAAAANESSGGNCGDADEVYPDFEATVAAFPPCSRDDLPVWARQPAVLHKLPGSSNGLAVKTFIFSPDAIRGIRARAASERVPNPTRFEAMAGFIWDRVIATNPRSEPDQADLRQRLLVSTEMRSRCSPSLPKEAFGNLVNLVMVDWQGQGQGQGQGRANLEDDVVFQELVTEIRGVKAKSEEITREFRGPKGSVAICAHHDENARLIGQYKIRGASLYVCNSLSKVGFNELDFGFGKPVWVGPTDGNVSSLLHKNNIILIDRNNLDDDGVQTTSDLGIEAWLFLEEKHMQILECDPRFLAFASRGMV